MKINNYRIKKSINILKNDGCIGIPTETVYGLAGNAYSRKAINKIFKLKKRPKKNPIIVHYYNFDDARKDIILNNYFIRLYKK